MSITDQALYELDGARDRLDRLAAEWHTENDLINVLIVHQNLIEQLVKARWEDKS